MLSIDYPPAAPALDPGECDARYAEILSEYSLYNNLGVIGLDGKIVCSAIPRSATIDLSARPYFQRLLQGPPPPLGEFEIGLLARPSINIGLPVYIAGGKIQSVLFASINPQWFESNARSDPPDQLAAEITDQDGTPRLYAFVPIKPSEQSDGLWVGIGISSAAVYAQADRQLQVTLGGLIIAAILAGAIGWVYGEALIVRPTSALIAMTERIRSGDLRACTPRDTRGRSRNLRARWMKWQTDSNGAIKNARAEQAEHDQRAFAEALRDISAALNSTLNFDQVLDRTVRCRGYAERGAENWPMRERFAINRLENIRRLVRSGGLPDLVPDTLHYAGWVFHPETAWIRSHLGAPIQIKNRVIGILNLDSATPGYFIATHAARLKAFADQAAMALENARLLRETERRAATRVADPFASDCRTRDRFDRRVELRGFFVRPRAR